MKDVVLPADDLKRLMDMLNTLLERTGEEARRHKPKVPSDKKLAKLSGRAPYRDVVLPAFVHYIRRFMVWRETKGEISPVDEAEQRVFDRLARLIDNDVVPEQALLRILNRFDEMKDRHKEKLFTPSYMNLQIEEGVLSEDLARDFAKEVMDAAHASGIFKWKCPPGRLRQRTAGGGELLHTFYTLAPRVRIWEVNGLRGAEMDPPLQASDYGSDELAKKCKYEVVEIGGEEVVKTSCEIGKFNPPTEDCEGEHVGDVCLRVPNIAVGDTVRLIGANFFEKDIQVHLRHIHDPQVGATFGATVCGDLKTPMEEIVNGAAVIIDDSRVRDEARFYVDPDVWTSLAMPAGIYNLTVEVPNTDAWHLPYEQPPQHFLSNKRPVRVSASQGDYKVWIDEIECEEETDGGGSDDVGVVLWGAEYLRNNTVKSWDRVQDETNNRDLTDVDSNEWFPLKMYLLGDDDEYARVGGDLQACSVSLTGYEIDDTDVYKDQVREGWTIFKEMWDELQLPYEIISTVATIAEFVGLLSSLGASIVGAIAAACAFIISVFYAMWAPPDLIMRDNINLTLTGLDFLTHPMTQVPKDEQYEADSIKVQVVPEMKFEVHATQDHEGYMEYIERRRYRCDDEDSTYWLTLRYRRKTEEILP